MIHMSDKIYKNYNMCITFFYEKKLKSRLTENFSVRKVNKFEFLALSIDLRASNFFGFG